MFRVGELVKRVVFPDGGNGRPIDGLQDVVYRVTREYPVGGVSYINGDRVDGGLNSIRGTAAEWFVRHFESGMEVEVTEPHWHLDGNERGILREFIPGGTDSLVHAWGRVDRWNANFLRHRGTMFLSPEHIRMVIPPLAVAVHQAPAEVDAPVGEPGVLNVINAGDILAGNVNIGAYRPIGHAPGRPAGGWDFFAFLVCWVTNKPNRYYFEDVKQRIFYTQDDAQHFIRNIGANQRVVKQTRIAIPLTGV